MTKSFLLSFAFALVVGCGGDSNSPSTAPDMTTAAANPDMSPAACPTPTDNLSFLDSCAPATVDFVDIMPEYPTLAPGGVLPALTP